MDRAAILRTALFSAYGVAVGVGWVALMHRTVLGNALGIVYLSLVLPAIFGFMGWAIGNNSEASNFQRLVLIPLCPFALLGGVFGMAVCLIFVAVVFPIALVGNMKVKRNFRAVMRSKRRFLDIVDLRQRLEAGEGTLIEETGHKGPYRVWWTDEDVTEKGTLPSTKEEFVAILQGDDHPFNSQCLKEYLDPNTGKAFFTSLLPKHVKSSKFTQMYPRMTLVMMVRPLHNS